MHRHLSICAVLWLAGLAMAQQKSAPKPTSPAKPVAAPSLPTEDVVNAFMQQTLGYDPAISWKIVSIKPSAAEGLAEVNVTVSSLQGSQVQKFYVTPDSTHVIIGEILPFGPHPFDAVRDQLQKGINGPSHGAAGATVTVVEFSDLQCPHCKDEQPALDRLAAEDKNARVVFQNYPLTMHDWALKAASYADCVGRSSLDAFWKFIQSIYGAQSDITASNVDEKLTGFADAAGVKGSDIAICVVNPETTTRVQRSMDLGQALDVNSTPTIFINGRKLSAGGLPYDVLQKLVDFAASNAK
jgi:protein-disulfide isomerase